MKPKLLMAVCAMLLFSFLLSSCTKNLPENRIVGNWRLVDVERKRLFDTDNITTGYEQGLFTFFENGSASYADASGTLNGNWNMRKANTGYYDSDGNWQSDTRTIFIINLHDFVNNRVIDLFFDRIDFRWSGDKLFAYIDGASYTYRYDFRRQ
jgi:hypothetical protein